MKRKRGVVDRWGGLGGSFTMVSNLFLSEYAGLGLSPREAMLVVHLMTFKWDDTMPFPSRETLAALSGCGLRAVDRAMKKLEPRFLRRVQVPGRSTHYDLGPLFAELKAISVRRAEEKRAARAAAEQERAPANVPVRSSLSSLEATLRREFSMHYGRAFRRDTPEAWEPRLFAEADRLIASIDPLDVAHAVETAQQQGAFGDDEVIERAAAMIIESHGRKWRDDADTRYRAELRAASEARAAQRPLPTESWPD